MLISATRALQIGVQLTLAERDAEDRRRMLQRRRAEVRVVVGLDANLVSGWVYQSAELLERLGPGELVEDDRPVQREEQIPGRVAAGWPP